MTTTTICLSSYRKYLQSSNYYGDAASWAAYKSVRIRMEFEKLEQEGLVKIEPEVSLSAYDFSHVEHIKSESERAVMINEIFTRIEKVGLWCYVAFFRALSNEDWKIAGSLDAIIGDGFHYSGYDTALMEHAIDSVYDQFKFYRSL